MVEKKKKASSKKTAVKADSKTASKKALPAGAGWIYFFVLFSLFIVGMAFANTVDYWIEDFNNLPLHSGLSTFLFGGNQSYAQNISWQIVASVIFIALFFMDRRNLKMSPALFDVKGRKKLLTTLIVVGSLTITTYLVTVIYSYFSGISEHYGLVRIAVVLFVLALGVAFSYAELTQKKFVLHKTYTGLIVGALALGMVTSIMALQSYGSPALMRQARMDLDLNNNLESIAKRTRDYYAKAGALPQDLKNLKVHQNLDDELLKNIVYKKLSATSFEVCGDFKTSWKDARRMRNYWNHNKYQKGTNCRKHLVQKDKKGRVSLEVITKEGVRVFVY